MDREYLARLLEGIGNDDEEARRELLAYIERQPAGIKALAYEALQDGGEETYDQLMLTLADDPSLYIRPARRTADEKAVPAPPPTRPVRIPPEVITALRAGERAAQVRAARELADYGAGAVPYLIEGLKSNERHVMGAAAEALQAIGSEAASAVLPLTGDRDELLRWHAYKVLSTTAGAAAIPALIVGLEAGNSGIRWLAAEGLVHVGRAALEPLLRRLTEEKVTVWLRNGIVHVLDKIHWSDEGERGYYTRLASEIKVAPTASLSQIARRELEHLA